MALLESRELAPKKLPNQTVTLPSSCPSLTILPFFH